ncbi:uncharacterized protein [Montipora capricornis]|uniref:uncharacterized protein isoform X1 n=1 Tax=Montipora capricornis TaxID=246305 RepID=UPI0035F1B181
MAVLVHCCCCGCKLNTGVLLLAILSVAGGGYEIYSSFSSASALTLSREDFVSLKYYDVVINLLKTNGVFNIIVVLTSLLLIGACNWKNRFLILPYLVWHVFLFVYNLGVTIFYIIIWKGFAVTGIVIFNPIIWVFSVYFLIVVYSFHEALREDPSGKSAGYTSPNRPGQAASGPPPAAVQMNTQAV